MSIFKQYCVVVASTFVLGGCIHSQSEIYSDFEAVALNQDYSYTWRIEGDVSDSRIQVASRTELHLHVYQSLFGEPLIMKMYKVDTSPNYFVSEMLFPLTDKFTYMFWHCSADDKFLALELRINDLTLILDNEYISVRKGSGFLFDYAFLVENVEAIEYIFQQAKNFSLWNEIPMHPIIEACSDIFE